MFVIRISANIGVIGIILPIIFFNLINISLNFNAWFINSQ